MVSKEDLEKKTVVELREYAKEKKFNLKGKSKKADIIDLILSQSKSRSPSPKRKSPERRSRSKSPKRRSPSPKSRSPSPKKSPLRRSKCKKDCVAEDKVCNEATGRCIKKDSKKKPKARSPSPKRKSPSPKKRSPSPKSRSPKKTSKCKKDCAAEDKVCNEATGRCIKNKNAIKTAASVLPLVTSILPDSNRLESKEEEKSRELERMEENKNFECPEDPILDLRYNKVISKPENLLEQYKKKKNLEQDERRIKPVEKNKSLELDDNFIGNSYEEKSIESLLSYIDDKSNTDLKEEDFILKKEIEECLFGRSKKCSKYY